ncbi:MAG: biotin transporter BioY [Nitrososphaerota archaeon]
MSLKPYDVLNIALFSTLTAIGAYIRIPLPFSPIPITLQTMFTYMAGALLGSKYGALSQLIYILLGISGLPIFAGGGVGFSILFGPTGGYLNGFVIGAFIIGKLIEIRKRFSFLWLVCCMIIGTIPIYTLGFIQLMIWMKINMINALIIGVLPFIFGDSLKILIAAYITYRIKRMLPTFPTYMTS